MAQRDWLSEAVDAVGGASAQREQQATATYLSMRRQMDTDEAARQAAELARWSGLPTETAARNRKQLQQTREGERDASLIAGQPRLQGWLTADPKNPASAAGDVDKLAAASYWFGPAGTSDILQTTGLQPAWKTQLAADRAASFGKRRSTAELMRDAQSATRVEEQRRQDIERNRPRASTGSVFKGLAVDTVEGLKQSWIGTKMFMADAVGIPRDSDVFTNILGEYSSSQERALSYRPVIESTVGQAVYGGGTSFLQTLPALAAAPFTDGTSLLTLFGTQAGTQAYGKYAARGATPGQALLGSTLEGGIEAATELLPTRFLLSRFGEKGVGSFVAGFLGREMLGEQIATASQDAVDTAIANPTATWAQYLADRPRAAFDTAVAVGISTGALSTGSAMFRSIRQSGRDLSESADAVTGARFLDQAIGIAEESKLRATDPEGFRDFVRSQTEGSPVENVYVPAEAVRSLMQSEGRSLEQDEFWSRYSDQIAQASEIGGDIVIPIADAVVGFAGNSQWDTLRDAVRLSPGGISMAEARSIAQSYEQLMEERGGDAAAEMRAEAEKQAPAARIANEIFSQARQAGMSINAARSYADLYASRYQTRAERLGTDAYDLYRQSLGGIVGEAPSIVRRYDAADEVDKLVSAMRRDKSAPSEKARLGPSLLDWLAARGGLDDAGGDLAAMGADAWHRAGAFRRKLVRRTSTEIASDAGQGTLMGGGDTRNIYSPDVALRDAIEAGYFPELAGELNSNNAEALTPDHLLNAVREELAGSPRYAETQGSAAQEADAEVRDAAEQLRGFLENRGIDPDTAPVETIRDAINREEGPVSRAFDQWSPWNEPPPGMSDIVLHHNGPAGLPRGKPSSQTGNYFGTADFSDVHGSDFGPWRYSFWVPHEVADRLVDLGDARVGTASEAGRQFAAEVARRAYPNEPEFAEQLEANDADAWADFYEAWADRDNLEPVLADLGYSGARFDQEYFLLPEAVATLRDRRSGPDDGTISFYQSQPEHPPFYSALGRAVANIKTAKASAEQWLATLRNTPGVKAEELEWSGIPEWLEAQPGAISRTDLQAFLAEGGVSVDEVLLGDVNARAVEAEGQRLYDEWIAKHARELIEDQDETFPGLPEEVEETDDGGWEFEGWVYDTEDEALEAAADRLVSAEAEWERENYQRVEAQLRRQFGEEDFIDQAKENLNVVTQFGDYTTTQQANPSYRELLITLPLGRGTNPRKAPDTHWSQPGVVAHLRFQDKRSAAGDPVLFIEEVQSDWHQKGRDEGYEVPPPPEQLKFWTDSLAEAQGRLDAVSRTLEALGHEQDVMPYDEAPVPERGYGGFVLADQPLDERASYARVGLERLLRGERSYDREVGERPFDLDLQQRIRSAVADYRAEDSRLAAVMSNYARATEKLRGKIPQAPFKSSWPALVMKRAIRWAVDHGHTSVAWTTGDQQAERYSLSSAVGTMLTYRNPEGDGVVFHFTQPGVADLLLSNNAAEGTINTPESQRIGGEGLIMTRDQAVASFGEAGARAFGEGMDSSVDNPAQLSGDDLKVGGEGMRAFYDRNLVNITNGIIKKYGAKVAAVDVLDPTPRADQMMADAERARRDADALAPVDERRATTLYADANAAELGAQRMREAALNKQWSFDITPELAKAASEGFSLFQGGDTKARGRIDFNSDGAAIIRLFEGHDLSTLLHESGHLWLEELRSDAVRVDAPQQLKDDWETVRAWFEANGHSFAPEDRIPTDAHEMWARGMERYFMEGKAPTTALSRAFASFRSWLLRIYQVVANLNAPLQPEVRAVMDRMLATDDALAASNETTPSDLMFKTAEQAGMTDAEFEAYRSSVSTARTSAMDALIYRTMETIRRQRTAEWKRDRSNVRAEMDKAVRNRAEFRALALLRGQGGPRVQLSRSAIVDEYGSDFLAMLPRGVPPTIVDKGGVHPDVLAEMSGFRTGREMLHMIAGLEARQRELRAAGDRRSVMQEAIDQETETAMRDRFGDVLADGSIEEEALAAIHNDQRAEVIASEARALSRRSSRPGNQVPTPWTQARAFAERVVREGKVSEQASGAALARHRRNEEKAARAAEKAMLAGNVDEAFRQKQNQLHHHALFRAAKDAKDQVDVIVKRLGKYAKAKRLPSMDPDYLDRIHELLEAFDFRRRTARDIKERITFAAWVDAREAQGEEVFIPDRLKEARQVNFSEIEVQDLIALDDTVESIAHLGRRKEKLLAAREEARLDDLVAEAVANADTLPPRKFSNERNPSPTWRSRLRTFDAMLVKVEWLADQLDRENPNGVFNRVLIRGADDAANEKERLAEKVLKPLADLYNDMPKEQRLRLQRKVVVPELVTRDPETLQETATVYTGMDLLAIALNTGNESNLDKMVRGESRAVSEENAWDAAKVMTVLDRELEKADWDFVEKVWRQVDSLWPDIVRSEREITGVKPEKVEPRIVQTRHGAINGGYYPVVYDPTRSAMAEANYDDDAEKLLGQMGRTVATPKGHTITRTSAAAPLLLSVEGVLLNHINRVTTRIAYGRFLRDALKFTNHPKIKDLINRKLGPEYHKQLRPWLARQVNDASMDTKQLAALDRIFRQFRINGTLVGLGFRVTTMLAQVGGWANSMSRLGPKWMATGMAEMARNYGSIREHVFSRSPEMAGRAQSFDRDVRAAFRQLSGNASRFDKVRAIAYWGIGNVQLYMVDMPTWLGAYSKATHEGMNEADAIAYADKLVRKTQGAGRAKDLSAIQGGPEMAQILTMFYSYFNVLYNAQRETVHSARTGDYRRAAANVFWLMMVGPLVSAFLTGDWPQDDEDEEGWGAWALRKMFFGLWAGVPLIRDAANYAERKVSGQFTSPATTPIVRAWTELFEGPVTDAVTAAKGDPVSDRWLQHAVTAPGYFLGLPTGQAGNTAQYFFDVAQGRQNPDGIGDVAAGAMKGPRKDQE